MRINNQNFEITTFVSPNDKDFDEENDGYVPILADFVQSPSIRFLSRVTWLADRGISLDLCSEDWVLSMWASNVAYTLKNKRIDALLIANNPSTLSEPFFHRSLQEDKQTTFIVPHADAVVFNEPIPGFDGFCFHHKTNDFLTQLSEEILQTEDALWVLWNLSLKDLAALPAFLESLAAGAHVMVHSCYDIEANVDIPQDVIYHGSMTKENSTLTQYLVLIVTD